MLAQCIIYNFLTLKQGTQYRRSCCRNFKKGSFNWKLVWLIPFLIVESDWKATSTPSMPTISRNTSNQNFQIAILFSVVDFQIEIMFLRRTLPTALRARVVSYVLGEYKAFLKKALSQKLLKGILRLEIETPSALFNSRKLLEGKEPPLTPTISRNTSNQNFEIAILFNVVEKSGNYVFEDDNSPPIALMTRAVSYALGAYNVFIESYVMEASKRDYSVGN